MIPSGFRFAGARCGLKNKRNDIGLIISDLPTVSEGVVTQNFVRAACVDVTKQALEGGIRGVVINSGNANCCTGEQGLQNARQMATWAAERTGLPVGAIAVASTGVIGKQLDMAKVDKGISLAVRALGTKPKPLAEALMTTDLTEKTASVRLGDGIIFGVAKGSGMIAPNMATMLAFVMTDLDVTKEELKEAFLGAVDESFNAMTVDGDTSTNDMAIVISNGASRFRPPLKAFRQALTEVCVSLAKQIARDGEGATKLIEIVVRGSSDPKTIARTIASSPLVKTAMFGCDPNWGRVMMAAGRAGISFDQTRAKLTFTASGRDFVLCESGAEVEFDPAEVSGALKCDEVKVLLELGGENEGRVYTCDFGYGYVRINAEYHT